MVSPSILTGRTTARRGSPVNQYMPLNLSCVPADAREFNPEISRMDRDRIASLWALIEPVLEPEAIELVELEFKLERGRWVLRLYIDTAHGVTHKDCAMVSRQIGALLDMEDPIDHPYDLEVSSPGINRVLRREKDFRHFAGSPVRIKTRSKVDGRKNFFGTLRGFENSRIILEIDGKRVEIDPDDVERARLDLPQADLFRRDVRRGTVATG